MGNIANLMSIAETVRTEQVEHANSAERIGSLFKGIISELDTIEGNLTKIINNYYGGDIDASSQSIQGGSSVEVIPIVPQNYGNIFNTHIASIIVNNESKEIYAPSTSGSSDSITYINNQNLVSVVTHQSTGTPIATITVKDVGSSGDLGQSTYELFAPMPTESTPVTIERDVTSGNKIAKINGTQLYAPATSTGVEITNRLTEGSITRICTINGTDIYAPVGSGSGSGSGTGGGSTYDDSAIWARINQVKDDLDNILERERDGITQMVNDILNGKNFVDGWQAGWNEQLKTYLISVGVLGQDGISKGWAYLEVQYNNLAGVVNNLTALTDENGNPMSYEMLQSLISAAIENDTAITQLKSRYALTTQDQVVLQWLSSGLYSEASANKTMAQVFASAENYQLQQSAITALNSRVDTINGNYVATGELATKVENIVTGKWNMSGFLTQSSLDSTLASMFATDGQKFAEIVAAVENKVSSLQFTADKIESIASSYVVKMKKLMLGNDNFYMHTINPGAYNMGFEMVVSNGAIAVSNDGFYSEGSGSYTKLTMYPNYIAMNYLSCDHIIMSNGNQSNGSNSWINMEQGTTFNWYNDVSAGSGNYSFNNQCGSVKYHGAGLQILVTDNGALKDVFSVTASGVTIKGNVTVNGTLVHN